MKSGIPISVGSSSAVAGSAPAVWPASERTDTLSVQVVDRPRVSPSGFPAAVHLYESLVGATSVRAVQEWCPYVLLVPSVSLLLLVTSTF